MTIKLMNKVEELDQIINGKTAVTSNDIVGTYYFKEDQIGLDLFVNSISIWSITDAMKQGKKVAMFKTYSPDTYHNYNGLFGTIWDWESRSDISFVEWVKIMAQDHLAGITEDNYECYLPVCFRNFSGSNQPGPKWPSNFWMEKASEVFNPYFKPKMVNVKTKWTTSKIVKAVLTGQITSFEIDQETSDDYRYDAALNFKKGQKLDLLSECKSMTQKNSHWNIFDPRITDCDIKSFTLDVSMGYWRSAHFEVLTNPTIDQTYPFLKAPEYNR